MFMVENKCLSLSEIRKLADKHQIKKKNKKQLTSWLKATQKFIYIYIYIYKPKSIY